MTRAIRCEQPQLIGTPRWISWSGTIKRSQMPNAMTGVRLSDFHLLESIGALVALAMHVNQTGLLVNQPLGLQSGPTTRTWGD